MSPVSCERCLPPQGMIADSLQISLMDTYKIIVSVGSVHLTSLICVGLQDISFELYLSGNFGKQFSRNHVKLWPHPIPYLLKRHYMTNSQNCPVHYYDYIYPTLGLPKRPRKLHRSQPINNPNHASYQNDMSDDYTLFYKTWLWDITSNLQGH